MKRLTEITAVKTDRKEWVNTADGAVKFTFKFQEPDGTESVASAHVLLGGSVADTARQLTKMAGDLAGMVK